MKSVIHIIQSLSVKVLFLLGILVSAATATTHAQSEITFKVNLSPQLEDSSFIPGEDQIYLKGNQYPLGNNKKIYLKDVSPIDSVYEATVTFPPSAKGKQLNYNFYIQKPQKTDPITESMQRSLNIRSEDQELGAIYFDSFAW
jgi:hypothetical protein